ncbi:MAG: FHA domain-containing protein [Actinobacteria bacterium]|nr:FHA domain-containing protein [Actinomycetota bacterium]
MTEFALTLLRLAFLGALWLFVIITVVALRRDLLQPREARPASNRPVKPAKPAKPPKPPKAKKSDRVGPSLVIVDGPLTNTVIPLGTAQITIGRAPDSTIVIDDDYASSRHARIYPSDGGWIVEDLGSTNGTWIERTRITQPTALTPGTPLRVGRTTLQLRK